MWFATQDGLNRYDGNSFKVYRKNLLAEGSLKSDAIFSLAEDADGCGWGSTNKGLFRLDLRTKKVKTYTHSDGLLGDQFNYKSGFVSRTGKMYFGGVKGFVAFEPRDVLSSPSGILLPTPGRLLLRLPPSASLPQAACNLSSSSVLTKSSLYRY